MQRARRGFYLILFFSLLGGALSKAYSSDSIIAVKTVTSPEVATILEGVNAACRGRSKIIEFDMRGQAGRTSVLGPAVKAAVNRNPAKYILAIGDPAIKLVNETGVNTPIFFTMISYPKAKGFFGRNIGGISLNVPFEDQVNQLRTIIPIVKSVGIVHDNGNGGLFTDLEKRAANIGVELVQLKISSNKDLAKAITEASSRIDALIVFPDSTVINERSYESIIESTIENKVPTVVYSDFLVRRGFLLSLTPDYFSMGQQAGKHMCGCPETASSITVPEKITLTVNLRTAKSIGLNISASVISAAKVIE